jgi:hypothetical protein
MADKKISALTAASTPLAGTEVLPIVQSGATVKVSVSDLTAGRAISGTSVTASTGNFVVGTSGQGIDFSATPGTGTSELLADYEEGTFTPVLTCETPGNLAITYGDQYGYYTKIGNRVFVNLLVSTNTFTHTTASGNARITGLPYTSSSATQNVSIGTMYFAGITKVGYTQFNASVGPNNSYIQFGSMASALAFALVQIGDLPSGGTPFFYVTISYTV